MQFNLTVLVNTTEILPYYFFLKDECGDTRNFTMLFLLLKTRVWQHNRNFTMLLFLKRRVWYMSD